MVDYREELKNLCNTSGTDFASMMILVNMYIRNGMEEQEAYEYACDLLIDGTIDTIKVMFGDGTPVTEVTYKKED